MKVRFLCDEHMTPRLNGALLRYERTIEILRIGDEGAPPFATSDPAILRFVEQSQHVLVTQDYQTLPDHSTDHIRAGGHHWGIFLVRPGTTIGDLAEALYEIWYCGEAEDWIDRVEWIPF